jgi:hypothetical protein
MLEDYLPDSEAADIVDGVIDVLGDSPEKALAKKKPRQVEQKAVEEVILAFIAEWQHMKNHPETDSIAKCPTCDDLTQMKEWALKVRF